MPHDERHSDLVELQSPPQGSPAAAEPSIRMAIVTTTAEFDALEEQWNILLEKSPARVFQTFEWLRTWWEYKARANEQLHIIVFSDSGTTVGIAPLALQIFRVAGIRLYSRLQFIGAGLTDYSDFIIAPGYEAAVYRTFARYLAERGEIWDVLDLEDVNEESLLTRRFPDYLRAAALPVYSYQGNVCPWFELPASPEGVLSHMGPSSVSNLKRKQKKLFTQFGGELKIVSQETDGIAEAIDDFSIVHGNRWKNLGFPSAFDDPKMREYHVSFAGKFARRGWLRLYLMYANGRPVAVHFGFNFRGRIYVYQGNAFGPAEVMRYSPGLVIRIRVITDGVKEGMRIFDYLRGDEEYKDREWKTIASRNYLLRTASPGRTKKVRFLFFLLEEFCRKCRARTLWEYYGYRRFCITKDPTLSARLGFIGRRAAELLSLSYDFLYRHSPLRSVAWLRLRKGTAERPLRTREGPDQEPL